MFVKLTNFVRYYGKIGIFAHDDYTRLPLVFYGKLKEQKILNEFKSTSRLASEPLDSDIREGRAFSISKPNSKPLIISSEFSKNKCVRDVSFYSMLNFCKKNKIPYIITSDNFINAENDFFIISNKFGKYNSNPMIIFSRSSFNNNPIIKIEHMNNLTNIIICPDYMFRIDPKIMENIIISSLYKFYKIL